MMNGATEKIIPIKKKPPRKRGASLDNITISTEQVNDDIENEFSHPSHRSFVRNLRIAQDTAFVKKKRVEVVWREYKTSVEPTGPRFSKADIRRELLMALRGILRIQKKKKFSPEEEQVFERLSKQESSSAKEKNSPKRKRDDSNNISDPDVDSPSRGKSKSTSTKSTSSSRSSTLSGPSSSRGVASTAGSKKSKNSSSSNSVGKSGPSRNDGKKTTSSSSSTTATSPAPGPSSLSTKSSGKGNYSKKGYNILDFKQNYLFV